MAFVYNKYRYPSSDEETVEQSPTRGEEDPSINIYVKCRGKKYVMYATYTSATPFGRAVGNSYLVSVGLRVKSKKRATLDDLYTYVGQNQRHKKLMTFHERSLFKRVGYVSMCYLMRSLVARGDLNIDATVSALAAGTQIDEFKNIVDQGKLLQYYRSMGFEGDSQWMEAEISVLTDICGDLSEFSTFPLVRVHWTDC